MTIKKIFAIASAKGGVGKSSITAGLAIEAAKSYKVGLLDADIYGPSIPKMFNINECDSEMKATINAFSNDLKNIRTGRVSPEILKNIIIDSYGSKMPLTQLSNINNLDNMTLSINIWDASLTKTIEKNIYEELDIIN